MGDTFAASITCDICYCNPKSRCEVVGAISLTIKTLLCLLSNGWGKKLSSFTFWFLYNFLLFITMGHVERVSPKMQIHIQFHGSENTPNSLNPATEKQKEVQCDGLDKMMHVVPNSLGCQALLAFSASSSFMPRYTPKEY